MAAKIWTGVRSRASYLQRLSVVFAVELRLKIVVELYTREMSPTQFCKEFGGGSVSRLTRNFERLAETGWLRLIRTETGGDRRGGVEHFYRATELPLLDDESWSLLPYSIRVAFSWNAFKQIAMRVREAMQAAPFGELPERRLTSTPRLLDREGWLRVIEAVDTLFVSLFEEQADARLRVTRSGEELIRASVVLLAFESPNRVGSRSAARLAEGNGESLVPFPVRLSKVFADTMCMQIVGEANLREISAPLFYREVGGKSLEGVRRRFKMLAEVGWLKQVGQKTGGRRRGAVELFYRATGPAILEDHGPWTRVPDSLKGTSSWTIFKQLSEQVKEAMVAGTFDARTDRYLAWSLLRLDRQGWESAIAGVEALRTFVVEEEGRAQARIRESGERPVTTTVALAAFESPKESTREP